MMQIGLFGLGSMGKRRIRNLLALGFSPDRIVATDRRSDRRLEAQNLYGIEVRECLTVDDLSACSAVIVSTPPDRHLECAYQALECRKPMFIEASVISEGLDVFEKEANRLGVIVFPSCTLRFFPGPRAIRQALEGGQLGQVFSWQYQSGQYLPDWHPWEKIEDYYVSQKITGGCREIVPFECVWLTQVFGPILEVDARHQKSSVLPGTMDDIYCLQVFHENGVLGQMMVDVLSRSPVRSMRITGLEGTLIWDDRSKTLECFDARTQRWTQTSLASGRQGIGLHSDEPYIEEMQAFLNCVTQGILPEYTLAEDLKILKILNASEDSAFRRSRVILNDG